MFPIFALGQALGNLNLLYKSSCFSAASRTASLRPPPTRPARTPRPHSPLHAPPLDLTPRHTARLTRRSVSRRPASDHTIHTTHPTHTASSLSLSLSRARPLSLVLALTHTHPHTRMHTHPRARTQPCLSTRGAIRLARLSSQIPGKLCHTFARHRTLAVCGMHLRGKGTPR